MVFTGQEFEQCNLSLSIFMIFFLMCFVDIAIKYTNWESGSPNNALLCFGLRYTSQWLWYSYDCSGRYRFICLGKQNL